MKIYHLKIYLKGTFCGQGKYPLMTAARNNWFEDYLDLLSESPDEVITILENSNPDILESNPESDVLEHVTIPMSSSHSSSEQSIAHLPLLFFILMKTMKDV